MTAPIQVPPKGALVFANADYAALELRTLAQVCLFMFGQSRLAEVLNAGEDPHLAMGANMLGISYGEAKQRYDAGDHALDDARQAAKVANFGYPGGLGAEKLCLFARKTYKVNLNEDQARDLKRTWLATFPEFRRYFAAVNDMMQPEGATFRHCVSNRIRGNVPYTATCNSFFQGLGADATGAVLFLVSEACYTPVPCQWCDGAGCEWCGRSGVTPLYGTRLVNFIHDDYLIECPESRGHEVAHTLVKIMQDGTRPYLPDVPATAKPQLSRYWSKDAKQVWIDDPAAPGGKNRRLIPWPKID